MIERSTKTWAICCSVSSSARVNRVFWNAPIGFPNALRSFTYSTVMSIMPRQAAAAMTEMMSRSWGRFSIR
jgi:hypothetical protein